MQIFHEDVVALAAVHLEALEHGKCREVDGGDDERTHANKLENAYVAEDDAQELSKLPNLTSLTSHSPESERGMRAVSRIGSLRRLRFEVCSNDPDDYHPRFSGQWLESLAKLTKLEELHLPAYACSDRDWARQCALIPALTTLNLDVLTRPSDSDLHMLSASESLKRVIYAYSKVCWLEDVGRGGVTRFRVYRK